jgi:hypothetical protein
MCGESCSRRRTVRVVCGRDFRVAEVAAGTDVMVPSLAKKPAKKPAPNP